LLAELNHRGEVFQVDLVHDTGSRWNDPEIPEGPLREFEELIAFGVALKFQRHILAEGVGGPVVIDLDRVIDHQITGHDRVDSGRVSAHPGHRVPHRREVDDTGHAGEILEHHPGRQEGDFATRRGGRAPRGEGLHVRRRHRAAPGMPQGVFQQDADREGKPIQRAHALALELAQAEDLRPFAVEREVRSAAEGVGGRDGHGASAPSGEWVNEPSKISARVPHGREGYQPWLWQTRCRSRFPGATMVCSSSGTGPDIGRSTRLGRFAWPVRAPNASRK
jgi:hypothetical protein